MSAILGFIPWSAIFQLAISLIQRAIKHSDDLKDLEKEWLVFTRNINRKIPLRLSDETRTMMQRLDEEERLIKEKIDRLVEQKNNYQIKVTELTAENIILKNKNDKEINKNEKDQFDRITL